MPSLGRLGRRNAAIDESHAPIAGGSGEMPAFAWRCRVCRTVMRAARAPLWKRRKPISSWMLRRPTTGRAAGA